MLVHLGKGYFVEKNSILYVRPDKEDEEITISLNDNDSLCVPYSMLNKIIEILEK